MYGLDEARRAKKRRGGRVLAVESPRALFDLIEVLNDIGLGGVARDYFGEAPMLLARKKSTLRRRPATTFPARGTKNGAFMGVDLRSLNIWMALTPCGEDAPSLDVVARRLDYIVTPGGIDHTRYTGDSGRGRGGSRRRRNHAADLRTRRTR